MALLHCGIALLAAANTVVPSHIHGDVTRRMHTVTAPTVYSTAQAEHYLTAQQIEYVRPGLHLKLLGVTIGSDRKVVADVTFSDDTGQPLDRAGVLTPGKLSLSFILCWYNGTTRQYTDYSTRLDNDPTTGNTAVQASADSGGTFDDPAMGHAVYHFKTVLPASYDPTATHTLGIYATRVISLTDPIVVSKTYVDNLTYDFRPDGGALGAVWNAVTDATCNACHDPLSAHGSTGRRAVKVCVLCHSSQTSDGQTGNSVDMKVFIHKIHMGADLPSVKAGHPYVIIGHGTSDFSTVGFPQDIRNCTTCHRPDSPEGYIWYSRPSRAACGSCHDDIDWTTGANHGPDGSAGPATDDAACASCHKPEGENEWDASIKGAHTIPTKSAQLKGLAIEILNVSGAAPGAAVTVTFKVTNGDGSAVTPSTLGTLNILLGGPTTDYTTSFRESGKTATASGDAWTYTFKTVIPADATGTWTATADCYRNVTLNPAPRPPASATVREAAFNPIYNFAVTDAQPVARRTVVNLANCDKCHETLALHGGQRFKIEECVICHNPLADDHGNRPATAGTPESISFQRLIHRIHTGENLTQDFTVYGNGGSKNNYNDIRYPGDRRDCVACHAAGTYTVPLPDGNIATTTNRDYYSPMQPTAAACLGCHDTQAAAAHAFMSTAAFGEACEVCHASDAEFGVDKVHAR